MIAKFEADPRSNLSYNEQLGGWLARTQPGSFENGVFQGWTLDRHGKFVATVVRADPTKPDGFLCTVHKKVGFPNVPCACEEAMRAILDPDRLAYRDATSADERPGGAVAPKAPMIERVDFQLHHLERIVKPYTSDRARYAISRKHMLCDFMQALRIIERIVDNEIAEPIALEARQLDETFLEGRLRHQFGREPYKLGRYVVCTLIREFFGLTYHQTGGFLAFLHDLGWIDDKYPDADALCKWDRKWYAPQTLLAVNAYLLQALRPYTSGIVSFDGSGQGSHSFDNYRDDMRMKRIMKEKGGRAAEKFAQLDRDRRKHTFYHAHVLMDPWLMVMVLMSVTTGYASEKPEMQSLLRQANEFWPMEGGFVVADSGLNDVAVRNAITEVGAIPLVKWARSGVNAINPAKYEVATNPDLIEMTWLLAKQKPQKWLELYNPRWKSETLFGAIDKKYGGYVRSMGLAGASSQTISKFVCNTIERLAFAWRFNGLDKQYFGTKFQLGDPEQD